MTNSGKHAEQDKRDRAGDRVMITSPTRRRVHSSGAKWVACVAQPMTTIGGKTASAATKGIVKIAAADWRPVNVAWLLARRRLCYAPIALLSLSALGLCVQGV